MRRAAILLSLALVACGHRDEAHVTITAGDSLDAPTIATIRTLEFAVLGDVPDNVRYGISGELADRKTTWIYRAGASGSRIQFEVVARDPMSHIVASGRSPVVITGSSPVKAAVVLETTTAPNPDKSRLGESCTPGIDTCASGFCVDGVCCNTACDGACMTCNGIAPGTCSPQASGSDPDDDCAPGSSACGLDGTCDGAGACRETPAGVSCGAAMCAAGEFVGAAYCDGMGTCLTPAPRACAPYACNAAGNACATICASTLDCTAPATCGSSTNTANPPGSCGSIPLGNRCATDSQCAMGTCIDGVCCGATAACGTCQSCAVPGHEGACAPIPAGVADAHGACVDGGAASCGTKATCDGNGACEHYAAGTICAPAACSTDGTSYIGASKCAGDGSACPTSTPTSCGAYVCSSTDGAPGCEQACGTCTYESDPTLVPPLQSSCAKGAVCINGCLNGTAWTCQ